MAPSNALEKDGHRVDAASQKILWALRSSWRDRGWIRGSQLRSAAELSQNRQVFYRIETYLEPAGLVEEQDRRRKDDPRAFRLTDEGEQWVDAHEERLRAPASRMETQQLAREAMDEAEAAKESVQGYRKKLHRIKSDVDDLTEQRREQADRLAEAEGTIGSHDGELGDLWRSKASKEKCRDRHQSTKQELQEANRELRERVRSLEGGLEDAQAHIETLREDNTALQERLDAMESELGKSWTKKIRRG